MVVVDDVVVGFFVVVVVDVVVVEVDIVVVGVVVVADVGCAVVGVVVVGAAVGAWVVGSALSPKVVMAMSAQLTKFSWGPHPTQHEPGASQPQLLPVWYVHCRTH